MVIVVKSTEKLKVLRLTFEQPLGAPVTAQEKYEHQATNRDDICLALEFSYIKLRPRTNIWSNGNADSDQHATLTPTATNTPIPPTATDTPIPPTTTNTPVPTSSKYQLKCDLAGQNADNYVIEITGETGTFQVTLNSLETNFDPGTGDFILTLNRDMLYVNSKHSYHIKGTITVGAEGVTAYDLTATGDTLAIRPRLARNPNITCCLHEKQFPIAFVTHHKSYVSHF